MASDIGMLTWNMLLMSTSSVLAIGTCEANSVAFSLWRLILEILQMNVFELNASNVVLETFVSTWSLSRHGFQKPRLSLKDWKSQLRLEKIPRLYDNKTKIH